MLQTQKTGQVGVSGEGRAGVGPREVSSSHTEARAFHSRFQGKPPCLSRRSGLDS